ncbi:MAG TPA: putative sulfate exporter family transporter [Thermomicrobiales bacterium]|nr:putative sulfate exporter family transporter [Thermomicrobiales bacterium]
MGTSIGTIGNAFDITNPRSRVRVLSPGILFAAVITAVAFVIAKIEELFLDHAILEPLVLALLIGLAVRALWTPPATWEPGIAYAGKQLLEVAIVVLGLTLNLGDIVDAGAKIVTAVLLLVTMTLVVGTVIGRALGLDTRLAVLVAVGNAICGNSAIAAVAPAIRAKKQEVASAIAMTAVLGVGVVLALPLLVPLANLTDERYGVIAGLSVYAVPQVLAATFTVSAQAGQIGSLVKLTRVMLLGPVVAIFAIIFREQDAGAATEGRRFDLKKFLPWFVIGFALCAALRTAGLVPEWLVAPATNGSRVLTAVAMAGLGLGVDVRTVRATGPRVAVVVLILTAMLVTSAFGLTWALGIG